jgi:uncharacterized membrane protein
MRLLGHPLHPMLAHFPIALCAVAAGAYLARVAGLAEAAAVAKLGNLAGLVIAVLAMIAGGWELRTIDANSAAMRVATAHMMTMVTGWVCFLRAFLLDPSAPILAPAAAALGFCLMAVGGWLGGRLAYEFGIGSSRG